MECLTPIEVYPDSQRRVVPCSKCLACLHNKRQDWIVRLNNEHKVSDGSLFVTLTYSDQYLPDSLSKRHLQLFMKRLRKIVGIKIRYYAVGEYGTKTDRPHYHILLFNLTQDNEAEIRKAWKFGHIHIGQITLASMAYVTKYIVQPEQRKQGRQRPFNLMSRSYGIGGHYLTDQMVAWHREDDRIYVVQDGKKYRLPRYYKEKIWYEQNYRKWLGQRNKKKADETKQRFYEELKAQGYNPEKLIQDMRNAWERQIKIKVAFTQTI